MRRTLIAAAVTTALALPGVALAHDGDRQRGEDHHGAHQGERHHARRHRHARLIAFHAHAPTATPPSVGSGAGTAPSPVASERAATVASFTNGTLTIALSDGRTVSGKVTPRTEIECHSTSATAADDGDRGRGEEGPGGGSSSGPGPSGQSGASGRDGRDNDGRDNDARDNDARDNDNDARDDNDDPGDDDAHDEAEHCGSAALVPGASVREALLSVGGAGAFWVKLEL
jgi:hypothetical protein